MSLVLCTREEESRSLAHGILMVTPDQAEEYLMHWRTKGSKNGHRLYQYEDGSLTPLGRIHYGVGTARKAIKIEKAEKYRQKVANAKRKENVAQKRYDKAVLQNAKKGDEKSEEKESKALNKLNAAKYQTSKYQVKVDKLEKKIERMDARDRKLEEKDKHLQEEADKATDDAVSKFVELWNKRQSGEDQGTENKAQYKRVAQTERVEKLAKDPSSFDSLSDKEKKKVGDELLKYLDMNKKEIEADIADYKKYYKDPWKRYAEDSKGSHEFDDYNKLQLWLTDRVYDKSGSWNAGYFDPNSKAGKVYPSLDKTTRDLWDREEKIEESTGVTKKNYDKWKKAMRNDSVWQSLNEAYKKSESDLCGAILEDIGFNDTPENRHMIIDFAFID